MNNRVWGTVLLTFFVLLVAAALILIVGASPLDAVKIFINGVLGTSNGVAEIMVKATPLIFTGLGVSLSLRTGFFNIGAEGQFYLGAMGAAMVAIYLTALPGPLRVLLSMLAALLVGGIWALIPAVMKNRLGISEAVSTIMLNYIAIMIVGIAVRGFLQQPDSALPQSAQVEEAARFPQLWHPTRLHAGFLVALLCVVLVWFILERTSVGFEMRMTGHNQRAAYCLGLPITRSVALCALIGGGLAGLAGCAEILGIQFRLLEGMSSGVGYTAVLIALLAKNRPFNVLVVSLLYAAFQVGANSMQRQLGVPSAIVTIITGLIVLILLGSSVGAKLKESKGLKVKA